MQTKQTKHVKGHEKRRHGRLSRTFVVELYPLSFSGGRDKAVTARCYDISEGGFSLESPKSFQQGTHLQARIHIPMLNRFAPGFFKVYENDADQYFTAIVEIVWCEPKGGHYLVGARYVNVDESQARALAGLINKAFQSEGRKS
ncbi:MAG: PilZ domain-containing protein [Desulfovibrionaceae bacterium]|nr:PilZ domain-containing protein [Desulfovibrionaceae bacterium]